MNVMQLAFAKAFLSRSISLTKDSGMEIGRAFKSIKDRMK
jgi:hypothetical protein